MECTLKPFLKSAVAFFFFLHGTLIGNGQQSISYNGTRLNDSFYLRINNTKQYDTARQRTTKIGN
jgi:hypothetical protein